MSGDLEENIYHGGQGAAGGGLWGRRGCRLRGRCQEQ